MASDWQRALVALTATVIGTVVVAVLYWARAIFVPVALAIFLAFVLAPVVARLQRRGLGRTPAVVVTVGLVVCGALGIGAVVAQQVVQLADTLPDRRETIKEKVLTAKRWVVGEGESRFGRLIDDVSGILFPKPAEKPTVAVEPSAPLGAQLDTYLSPAVEVIGQAAFTFILTVYMLLRREDLRNRMIRLIGAGKVTTTTKAVDDATRRISRYLLSQLVVNSAFGVIIAVGLFALGVKYSIMWGFIATLMRYVPYIGTWVGLIPPTLFSFATAPEWGGGWGQPIAVLVLFLGLEAFCNNIVEPAVYGQSMGLSEVAQLVATAFWAFLWGPMGLILAGPLTVCLLVLGRHVGRFRFFVVLLGDEPALDPRVAFYQRLAARDQDEAADVALEVARRSGPEETFDAVIVPALCLARRDHAEGDLDAADLRAVVAATREVATEVAELREVASGTRDDRVRVLVCPARDAAEHVAAEVLALALDPNRWEVRVAGDEILASELIELVAEFRPAAVVIVALPPGGLSHARYLLARLRQRFSDVKLLVGRWGCEEGVADPRGEALKNTDGVDHTIAETRKRLAELHPLVTAATNGAPERANKREAVGTAGA
jgi:predicted PurR-regulated permease PerM